MYIELVLQASEDKDIDDNRINYPTKKNIFDYFYIFKLSLVNFSIKFKGQISKAIK